MFRAINLQRFKRPRKAQIGQVQLIRLTSGLALSNLPRYVNIGLRCNPVRQFDNATWIQILPRFDLSFLGNLVSKFQISPKRFHLASMP